jgi:hypothetical protein
MGWLKSPAVSINIEDALFESLGNAVEVRESCLLKTQRLDVEAWVLITRARHPRWCGFRR